MGEMFDNRYEIIKRLGSGGMADVYLARDTHLGRDVAIKILYKRYANDEEFVARFRQEAQAAAGLNHPHIVSIYDRGEAEGSYYIAMEYLEGRSLKDLIAERGMLGPAEAIDIAEQILQALQFAHEHHVIHRDIKPHNIVINGRGQVKVTDFGIARAGSSSRMTETGSIIGTAQYLSPEQARGRAVEQGSDLYSLGVVLYEMLTGKVPFEGENTVATALMHLSDAPVPPQALVPEIPDNLNNVVMRSLAKDPLERYGSAEEFLADLERCRRDLPVAPPVPLSDTEMTGVIGPAQAATMVRPAVAAGEDKTSRKKKQLWLVLALAVLALLGAGIYLLAFAQQSSSAEVPDVVNKPFEQAQEIIRGQGLVPELEAEEFSDGVPAGSVIRQDPKAGARLDKNGTVRLVVSKGSGKVAVPELVGQSAGYAESKLREAELSPDRQPDVYSDSVPEGSVVSQDPAAGTQAEKGSSVKYAVSKGPQPPKEVVVPSVVGKSIGEAQAILAQAGLMLGSITEQNSNSTPDGQIISQNPSAGQKAGEGSAVNVVVSKGPQKKVKVPDVEKKLEDMAVDLIEKAGLVAEVSTKKTNNPGEVGRVISQSPKEGTEVNEGSTVKIVVGVAP